jgi:CheY-like chemotaxis protein
MRKLNSPEEDASGAPPPGGKILYIEDNEENRRVCEFRLKRQYQVILASDDREACAKLQEHGRGLTAILMDIELQGSGLNGVELAQLFRGKLSGGVALPSYAAVVRPVQVPLLFVTAYGARYSRDDLTQQGADGIIAKPVNFIELSNTLARLKGANASKAVRP